jgi:DNA-binding SARP family transcriptional activator/tetratricopeptide (TPR) repeat protein
LLFRVLGSLQVYDGVLWSPVRAARHRLLLAVLLTQPNRPITMDRLIDELWGEDPPTRAVKTVQVYAGRLRRLLVATPADVRAIRGRGYQLKAAEEDIDSERFERLVTAGREALAAGKLEVAVDRLRAGLAMWRGPAFSDVPACAAVAAKVTWLEQARLSAVEDSMGAELALGRHTQVVDELGLLAAENPLRERLQAQHIMALRRCGRRAEALAAYRKVRQTLVAELGLEPGPQLRGIEQAILTDDDHSADLGGDHRAAGSALAAGQVHPPAAGRAVPAQLPAEVAGFTGRAAEVKQLTGLLERQREARSWPMIATIAGMAGVGKTALALRWAHAVRDRFPDGQLYTNLRGYSHGEPLRPIEALAGFLRALGVSPDQVPVEENEAAGLYRSLLAGKRVFVVLDNAAHASQVRPLLPADPHCAVVVTSRDRLDGLVARDGATRVGLDVLTRRESYVLLLRLLGAQRFRAEPQAAAELARLCGYLPLALRVAAASLIARPRTTLAAYLSQLASGNRLSVLTVRGDPESGIRAAFDRSYAALPADVQRLFRLAALVPGPDVTAAAAAALTGGAPDTAWQLLDLLAGAHLLDEPRAGRYALHDLLRLYAASRTLEEDTEPARLSASDRLFGFYLDTLDNAGQVLYPHLLRLAVTNTGTGIAFEDEDAASAWLDAETPNIVAAITHTARHGPHHFAWQLADAIRGYLYLWERTVEWEVAADAAQAAALASGDGAARASARFGLAARCFVLDRYEAAVEHYTHALRLARQAGWLVGEATALNNLGTAHWALGEARQAADHYAAALAIFRGLGLAGALAGTLGNLAPIYAVLGQLDLAAQHRREAIELSRRSGSLRLEGVNLAGLSEILHAQQRFQEAAQAARAALAIFDAAGQSHKKAYPLRVLAAVQRDTGRVEQAMDNANAALELAREHHDRFREAGAHQTLATIQQRLDRPRQAADSFLLALRIAGEVGDVYLETEVMIGLAVALQGLGEGDRAAEYARRALATARAKGYRLLAAEARQALPATGSAGPATGSAGPAPGSAGSAPGSAGPAGEG